MRQWTLSAFSILTGPCASLAACAGGRFGSIPRDTGQTERFMAVGRVMLRGSRDGVDLPVEQYETWKEIELTFEPERLPGAVQ